MSLPSLFEISNLDHLEKYCIVLSISRLVLTNKYREERESETYPATEASV